MLRLGKVGPAGGAYYLAPAEGTGTGAEPAGQWLGRGVGALGLAGTVAREPFERLLAGCHPESGEPLGPSLSARRVGAYDLTFAAPKSVSLLATLAGAEVGSVVLACHQRAVARALGYLEERAAGLRVADGGVRRVEAVGGLVGAAMVHRTSRALDPHLHCHVVVANLGRPLEGVEGPWRSLDGRGFYAHRAAADALYHAELRAGLVAALGVGFEPGRRGRADLVGFEPRALACFSQRSRQIAEELARAGPGASPEVAARRTRAAKDPGVQLADLLPGWQARAAAVGLTGDWLSAVLEAGRADRQRDHGAGMEPGQLAAQVSARAGRLLRERGRPVAPRHVVAAVGWVLGELAPNEPGGATWLRASAEGLWARLAPPDVGRGVGGPGVAEVRVELTTPRIEAWRDRGPSRERGTDWGLALG
ncbi:MobF family relaxase [Aciditerrimonas ferrireducens]|nr:MobF family relaxase [Aciditerrimonas ferrireducens]